jgi:hypothetical protein
MKNVAIAVACGLLLAACGGKVDELKKDIDNMQQAVEAAKDLEKAAENIEQSQSEAEEVYKARAAKGDTIPKPHKELEAFLPSAINGYKVEGTPSGSTVNMSGFANSTTTQKWVSESGDGSTVEVTISDWGGGKDAWAYGSLATGLGMTMSIDNDQEHTETIKPDIPMTTGLVKFEKQSKQSHVTLATRYRYLITLQLMNGKDDQTKTLTDVGLEMAKKFDGM